jgi:Ankyrin repeat.
MRSSAIRKCLTRSAALVLLIASSSFAVTTSEKIQTLNERISDLSIQIRHANINKERQKAAELREEREKVQQELRELRRLEKAEKAEAEKRAKREATEKLWATFAPEKKLCAAIEYNREDLVKQAVGSGAVDLNKINSDCFFPLADAAARGQMEIVEYLLQNKSPLVMREPRFNRLLSAMDAAAASKQDRTEILALLKKHGASLKDSSESSMAAAADGADDAARKMIKERYNIAADQMHFGNTFTRALEQGHINNIHWLLDEGANPNEPTVGRTALMIAVDSNDLEKVTLMIQAGADPNFRDAGHSSVLAHAEKRREKVNGRRKAEMDEIIAFLKNRGATKSDEEET